MDKLDRKSIVAIALCIAFVVGYQPLLRLLGYGRYLDPPKRGAVVDTTRGAIPPAPSLSQSASPVAPAAAPGDTSARAAAGQAAPPATGIFRSVAPETERTFDLDTPLYRAHFSSRGARLLSVEFKRYASAHGVSSRNGKPAVWHRGEEIPSGDRVTLAGGPLLGLDLGSGAARQSLENVVFASQESTDAAGVVRVLTFTHRDASGLYVRQTFRADPTKYALDYEVEMRGVPAAWRLTDYSLTMRSWPLLSEGDPLSDLRALRASTLVGTNIHRDHVGGLLKKPKIYDGNVQWAAVQSRYFLEAAAVVHGTARGAASTAVRRPLSADELASLPANAPTSQDIAVNDLVLGLPGETQPVNRFVLYVGPCEFFPLASLKVGLERAVDLGWTWLLPFSKALLWLLNRIFDVVRNYGLAIVLLATLVRLALHPLNVTSMKSMRAMQRLQPELDRLRKKHKDDAAAMNTAMMALYKDNKVNPAGGCLPLVIQMPMFIALYNVLFNAIELRQAPFIAWMHDLSAPDLLFSVGPLPIRLLPILMAGSGFLQQLVTPTAPDQKPTMYMMNAVMLFFFYNLPSGLVLYWTVMNLLTALQQWHVMHQDTSPTVVVGGVAVGGASAGGGAQARIAPGSRKKLR